MRRVSNLIAQLKRGAGPAWAVLEYGWYPLLMFIATPWFLSRLGTEGYGHWMLLTATVGFGGVLNGGTGAATIKAVSAGIGQAYEGNVQNAVRVSIGIATVGGGVLGFLVLCVFWFAGSALLGRMGDTSLIRLTGVAAAALLWLEQLDNVFSSTLKGAEQFGKAARVEMISRTVQIVGASVVLWVWPTLSALYTVLFVVASLRLTAKISITKTFFRFDTLRPKLTGANEILYFAKWGWLQGIGGLLFGVADRMLVGSLLGSTSLSYYSIASQLAVQIHSVSAAGLSVIFPKVSRKLQVDNTFSLARVAKLTMVGNLVLSSIFAALLLVAGPTILRHWIGSAAAVPTTQLLPWLVLAYWALALNVVPYYILLGMGRIRFVGIAVLTAGLLSAVAMYFAIKDGGLMGSSVGRGMYALLSLVFFFPLTQHFIDERKIVRSAAAGTEAASSKVIM